eukprot:907670-Amphidinium_carterae.2
MENNGTKEARKDNFQYNRSTTVTRARTSPQRYNSADGRKRTFGTSCRDRRTHAQDCGGKDIIAKGRRQVLQALNGSVPPQMLSARINVPEGQEYAASAKPNAMFQLRKTSRRQ